MRKTLVSYILLVFSSVQLFAQALNNAGAAINVTSGTVLSGGGVSNTSGTLTNSGTVTLSGNYSNNGTVNGNGAYNVAGNWTNSGTFTPGSSTVTFNGATAQTLSGSVATPFYNITVNGTGGIKLSQNASFISVLNLQQGSISGTDTMTLISNASGTGQIAPVGAGITQSSITAKFTVQRFENQRTTANYTALSSPVVSTTIGDWNVTNRSPKFYMSGVGGPDGNAGSYVSVYKYAETTNVYNKITTYASPGINYAIKQGEGIYLWLGTSMSAIVNPFSFNTHGVPTIGNVNIGVTYTASKGVGFNIVGNPYASPIDWSSLLASNSTLQSSYYLFEQDGSWHAFTSGSIPMEQGFGVITSTAATVSFQESNKTVVDAPLHRQTNPSDEPNTATFVISDDQNDFSCPTIISFAPGYSKDYVSSEDAYYIPSFIEEAPQVYSMSGDGKNLMVNMMPDNDATLDIPLMAQAGINANYTITANNLSSVTSYNCILLIDKNTGAVLNNFLDNASYTFNVADAPETRNYAVRFNKLSSGETCTPAGNAANDGVEIYPTLAGASVSFNLAESENVTVTAFNVLGQEISPAATYTVRNEVINVPLPATEAIYIIRVETTNGIFTQKIYHKRTN